MLIPMIFYLPIRLISTNAVLALNLSSLIMMGLNFAVMYFVTRKFINNSLASFLSAFFYAFNTASVAHYFDGHLQLSLRFFLPILFWLLVKYFQKPSFKGLFLLSLVFLANSLTNIYFMVYGAVMAICVFVLFLYKNKKKWRPFVFACTKYWWVALPALFIFLWYYLPYYHFFKHENVTRDLNDNIAYSARLFSFVNPNQFSLVYNFVRIGFFDSEYQLWLQLFPIILLLTGVYYVLVNAKSFLWLVVLGFFWLSFCFGPFYITLSDKLTNIPLPYWWLYHFFLPAQSLRVPARSIFLALVPLSLLVGYGWLCWQNFFKKDKAVFFILILVFLVLENRVLYPFFFRRSVYQTAKQLHSQGKISFLKNKPVIHYPIYQYDAGKSYLLKYLSWAEVTEEKIFNGYSGYFPRQWLKLSEQLAKNPKKEDFVSLTNLGYQYAVVHHNLLDKTKRQSLRMFFSKNKKVAFFAKENISVYRLTWPKK